MVMVEAAGSQLHAATGSAPWVSVEEEEDMERMRQVYIQQWEELLVPPLTPASPPAPAARILALCLATTVGTSLALCPCYL